MDRSRSLNRGAGVWTWRLVGLFSKDTAHGDANYYYICNVHTSFLATSRACDTIHRTSAHLSDDAAPLYRGQMQKNAVVMTCAPLPIFPPAPVRDCRRGLPSRTPMRRRNHHLHLSAPNAHAPLRGGKSGPCTAPGGVSSLAKVSNLARLSARFDVPSPNPPLSMPAPSPPSLTPLFLLSLCSPHRLHRLHRHRPSSKPVE